MYQLSGSFLDLIDYLNSLASPISYLYIAITLIITIKITKLLLNILEPTNYELDMTEKKYCKSLAEIDNSLRFKRGAEGELYSLNANSSSSNEQLDTALDCATDLHNGGSRVALVSSTDFNNNNNAASRIGSSNHVYPNGWIPIMESVKVRPGTVKKAIIFGIDLIVTRSANGLEVSVLDAYCPHMGVHIGVGGQVRQVDSESCIECPFHGWLFRAKDGQCVEIPYQKNAHKCAIPKQAKLGTWPCVEVDNFIYVWHHIDGQPPSWQMIPSRELSANSYQLAGRSCHKTNLELRDVLENGADMNHFEGIHNDLFILGGQILQLQPLKHLQKYVRHHWIPTWKPVENEFGKPTHMAEMKLQSWITLFNQRLLDITVHATQIGPARVNLFYNSKWYGEGLLTMNAIPLGGRRVKYIQHIYTKRTFFQCFMAKWVLYGEIKMIERDFFIWNHKKNIRNPIFVPEDKTLKHFRRWYQQFYTRKRNITIQDAPVRQDSQIMANNKNGINNLVDF